MPKASELPESDQIKNLEPDLKSFESLFREVSILDNWLRASEEQAKNVGILMTPVLIIDGMVKYNGSVPSLPFIDCLLAELK